MNSDYYCSPEYTQHLKAVSLDNAKQQAEQAKHKKDMKDPAKAALRNGVIIPGSNKAKMVANSKELPRELGNTIRARQDSIIAMVNEKMQQGFSYEEAFSLVMSGVRRGSQ